MSREFTVDTFESPPESPTSAQKWTFSLRSTATEQVLLFSPTRQLNDMGNIISPIPVQTTLNLSNVQSELNPRKLFTQDNVYNRLYEDASLVQHRREKTKRRIEDQRDTTIKNASFRFAF